MQDFEKPGLFYLGKKVDGDSGDLTNEHILYDSKDLTSHAVMIGMTGSGKTGLGVALIEEAALDNIPVIAIDPKGDIGNLLLSFPELKPADFEPWVNPRDAAERDQTISEFAETTAVNWRRGLAEWGQTPERVASLRNAVDMTIYTPGSTAGTPISVLGEFSAPSTELLADRDLYRERLQGTATGLLTLLEIDADPVSSKEHILLSNILDRAWQQGQSLSLENLIQRIQNPIMKRIGAMDIDTFYPPKKRLALAMRVNNLLAAPGFDAWMSGPPLDIDQLLFGKTGKPQISIMSIAHLGDCERMFFVTMLLTEIIAWMRRQPGSGSLRAILYMDEIAGYLPPTAKPASKRLFMLLLKQARAFGLGLVLSTQNPVDLDYKALSNIGTWFIGRLQTKRDRDKVRDGLLGADSGSSLGSGELDKVLAGLGKRRFLMHNVHEDHPVLMATRWVMSYLAGPLTRSQIKQLSPEQIGQETDQTVNLSKQQYIEIDSGLEYADVDPICEQSRQAIAKELKTALAFGAAIFNALGKKHVSIINFRSTTLREHFAYWLSWRVTAAHHFCCSVMPAVGNKDIMQAPVGWYIPRFIAGLRLGPRYVKRVKREFGRLSKV